MTCAVDGCARLARERGLCHAHYRRVTRTGDPGPAAIGTYGAGPNARPACSVSGCPSLAHTHGLCTRHYVAAWRRGDLRTVRR